MEKYGLLGKNLGHSLSPFIHSILFEISGIKAEYKLYEADSVKAFIENDYKLSGFNITIPYKKEIVPFCTSLNSSATDLGVVNCVDSHMVGYNTDVYGYRESVSEIESDFSCKTLLLGCGGVGSMIAQQYKSDNLWIAIRNITNEKICNLENSYKGARVVDIDNIPDTGFDLIVNSTPVGMFPNINQSPVSERVVSNSKAVYDTIYNPYNTKLLQYAKELGKKQKNGLDMLVLQAVKSHEYWYGGKFAENDIAEIIRLTEKELEKRK
ncbi:MAG: shikimate dehydrogenase [Clostridia bacterium]|nr:shikimate dehydrogenase [Clostridia bacterium]